MYKVTVYTGEEPWDYEVIDLSTKLRFFEEAKGYAQVIKSYHPTYSIKITKRDCEIVY